MDILTDQPQAASHVHKAHHDGIPLAPLKHKSCGGLTVSDAQGMDLDAGPGGGHGGTDLQHMGAQAVLLALDQVVGIVLHEGGGAVAVFAHGLHDGCHGRDLPVALAAVAVALRHQVLAGQTRQLLHAVQVLEGVGERLASFGIQHLLDRDLLAGLVADGTDVIRRKVVAGAVDFHQGVNLGVGDLVHHLDQVAHGPGVDLPAQPGLDLHLVALGHGHFAHVVAEPHDLQLAGARHADGGAHPAAQTLLDFLILPVPGDDLARHPQPGRQEPVLPVAVGGLVQVHEIHVDLLVGDLAVVLGGKMAVGLLQIHKAVDPHLAGTEGVAPGDDARTAGVVVGLAHHVGNLLVGLGRDLVDHPAGQIARGVQQIRHLGGTAGHGLQHLGSVQKLTAHHKPEFIFLHTHCQNLLVTAVRRWRRVPPPDSGCIVS